VSVTNGKQVLEALHSESFNLVLMDVEMPDIDGLEATKLIRNGKAGELNRDIPIIAMTAHAMVGFRDRCIEAGMDDYISKPIDIKQLTTVIKKVTSGIEIEEGLSIESIAAEKILNKEAALMRFDNNEKLFHNMITIFLEQIPTIKMEIDEALKQGNSEEMRRVAHKYKSSATMIGAEICQDLFLKMEMSAKENRLEEFKNMYKQLDFELEKVKKEIEKQ
jgi:CheY-like chemotaxis protein